LFLFLGIIRTDVSEEHIVSIFRGNEALFVVRREAYPRNELERFAILVTLKMDTTCSSETSVLTRTTRCKVPKDMCNDTVVRTSQKARVLPAKIRGS
jgi:hypothetical protein